MYWYPRLRGRVLLVHDAVPLLRGAGVQPVLHRGPAARHADRRAAGRGRRGRGARADRVRGGAEARARRRDRDDVLRQHLPARVPQVADRLHRQPGLLERGVRLRRGSGGGQLAHMRKYLLRRLAQAAWSSCSASSCSPSWSPDRPGRPGGGLRRPARHRRHAGAGREGSAWTSRRGAARRLPEGHVHRGLGDGAAHASPGPRRPRQRDPADAGAGRDRDAGGVAGGRAARDVRGAPRRRRGRGRPPGAMLSVSAPVFLLALTLQFVFSHEARVVPGGGQMTPSSTATRYGAHAHHGDRRGSSRGTSRSSAARSRTSCCRWSRSPRIRPG